MVSRSQHWSAHIVFPTSRVSSTLTSLSATLALTILCNGSSGCVCSGLVCPTVFWFDPLHPVSFYCVPLLYEFHLFAELHPQLLHWTCYPSSWTSCCTHGGTIPSCHLLWWEGLTNKSTFSFAIPNVRLLPKLVQEDCISKSTMVAANMFPAKEGCKHFLWNGSFPFQQYAMKCIWRSSNVLLRKSRGPFFSRNPVTFMFSSKEEVYNAYRGDEWVNPQDTTQEWFMAAILKSNLRYLVKIVITWYYKASYRKNWEQIHSNVWAAGALRQKYI